MKTYVLALILVLFPAGNVLLGQGASVDQQGACMTGRMGAGVARPCDDGSAIYFNPAALAWQPTTFGIGVSVVRAGNTFSYDQGTAPDIERETEAVPVPHVYASVRVFPRLALGFGVLPPFGLGLTWPVCPVEDPACDEPNFEGRYAGYDNAIQGLYFQPTLAFAVVPDRLSVGAGLAAVRGKFEVRQRIDAPQLGLAGRDVADLSLEGGGWGVTGHVGVSLVVSPEFSVGARYLHAAPVELNGTASFVQVSTGNPAIDAALAPQFAPGGPFRGQYLASDFELPAQFVVGVAGNLSDQLTLFGDYHWTQWSTFDRLPVDFENLPPSADRELVLEYSDAHTFKLGAEMTPADRLSLRAGFRYNTAATSRATPFLPEGKRTFVSLGAGYLFPVGIRADLAWQYINQPDREGTVRLDGDIAGTYTSTGQIFAVMLSYQIPD